MNKTRSSARRWILILVPLALVAALALAWKLTPLEQMLDPRRVAGRLEAIEQADWAPLYFLAAFVVGSLVMFPVTALSAATAITFPPLKAAPISFTGIMLSAALMHWLGARLLRKSGRRALRGTIQKVDEVLQDRGVLAIATLRMMPIAPFSLVNLAAGAVGVPFRDYMLGSALGLAPGLTMVCLFGRQIRAFWRNPSASAVLWAVLITAAWLGVSIGLQRWIAHRGKRAR